MFGQENFDETYAIARSDMLVKGEGEQANNILFGSTISDDKYRGQSFDFMLSNPPFGTSWKKELDAWGGIKKDEISDSRFRCKCYSKKGPKKGIIIIEKSPTRPPKPLRVVG